MKSALITFGNEESYGLLFVGGELLLHEQEIHYFDAEDPDVLKHILKWRPDFIMFSPMTTFYPRALDLARQLKKVLKVTSCFGGHHAMSCPEIVEEEAIDVVVVGPVRGSIEQILNGSVGVIKTTLTDPSDLPFPARDVCYSDIPRLGNRYRKFMLSMLGCPWNCSYCSSSCGHMRGLFGVKEHEQYYLSRRPLEDILQEAVIITMWPTKEIEWVDDDVFARGADDWLPEFAKEWKHYVELPMYVSTTSCGALRAKDATLKSMQGIISAVGLGVQAARKESLKLFNRHWDDEERMKAAYDRLRAFGFPVNLQAIVGLPVSDPIEDAIDTIKLMQRVGPGSICSCYPLQVYPGTKLLEYCKNENIELNDGCSGDTNSGITGIKFDDLTTKRLRNICKLATLFVKYSIDEDWMRALIDVDFDAVASRKLSEVRYHDCVIDRLGSKGQEIFDEIILATKLRY